MQRTIDVCLTPALLGQYDLQDKIAVAIDILRASSTMATALANGAQKIKAVSTVEEALAFSRKGYLAAGERGGEKIEGFDFGNSPSEYLPEIVSGKSIALTTTNGTRCIAETSGATLQLIGGFLNSGATARYLRTRSESILAVCAGWNGTINLEDTVYAGYLISALGDSCTAASDSCRLALAAYEQAKGDLIGFLKDAGHAMRLARLGYAEDVEYCLQADLFDFVMRVENGFVERR